MRDLPLGNRFDPAVTSENEYLDVLYQTFLTDLVRGDLHWKTPATKISLRRQPEIAGRHATFWHIVSGGSTAEVERELDAERCIRIGWIRPLIEQFNSDFPDERLVHWWVSPNPRWRGYRYGLATDGYDYVVFIDERRDFALLISAYYVDRPRRRDKFRDEHDDFWKSKNRPHKRTVPGTPSTRG